MKRLQTIASIVLLLAACAYQGVCQQALSYSVKDDVAAASAYSKRRDCNAGAATAYKKAVDLMVKQKYWPAVQLTEEAIRLDPRCIGAYSSYGYCQIWLENYTDARDFLGTAIGMDSNQPILFYRKALCYFSIGAMDDAIRCLNHALALKPDDADALRLRARSYRRNDETNAIADFSRLIKNNAYVVESRCERGRLYAQIGEDDQALQDFDAALAIKPDEGEAYVGRANVFYKQHKYRLAADNYSAALVCGTDKHSFCEIQRTICNRFLNKKPNTPAPDGANVERNRRIK
jgi:tetratricopeptide (TPR) repeat protein